MKACLIKVAACLAIVFVVSCNKHEAAAQAQKQSQSPKVEKIVTVLQSDG